MSSFVQGMGRTRRESQQRHEMARQQWERLYENSTVSDACHYLRDYLDQFDVSGQQIRHTYDVKTSVGIEEILRRARLREAFDPRIEDVAGALSVYNQTIRDHGRAAPLVVDSRVNLAAAMLILE